MKKKDTWNIGSANKQALFFNYLCFIMLLTKAKLE